MDNLDSILRRAEIYKLAKKMVEASLNKELKEHISSYQIDEDYIKIVFNDYLAFKYFKNEEEEFLKKCRKYYAHNITNFRNLNYKPKEITGLLKKSSYSSNNSTIKTWDTAFENRATDPQIHKAFEALRECIKIKEVKEK